MTAVDEFDVDWRGAFEDDVPGGDPSWYDRISGTAAAETFAHRDNSSGRTASARLVWFVPERQQWGDALCRGPFAEPCAANGLCQRPDDDDPPSRRAAVKVLPTEQRGAVMVTTYDRQPAGVVRGSPLPDRVVCVCGGRNPRSASSSSAVPPLSLVAGPSVELSGDDGVDDRGRPTAGELQHATVTHRPYSARQVLLDEVSCYAAARQLASCFTAAFASRTRRAGGTDTTRAQTLAAPPDTVIFSAFVGILDCGPTVPLRRVDSAELLVDSEKEPSRRRVSTPRGAASSRASFVNDHDHRRGAAAASSSSPRHAGHDVTRTGLHHEQWRDDVCSALSHFTWTMSSGQRALVVVTETCREFVVGVAVHTNTTSVQRGERPVFGSHLNGERAAIAAFTASHRCNAVCRMLALPPLQPLV